MTTPEDREIWERDQEALAREAAEGRAQGSGATQSGAQVEPVLPDPARVTERLGFGRKRAHLTVSVNLDPVPGWGNTAEDYRALTQRLLDDAVGHYDPVVALADSELAALVVERDELRAEVERLRGLLGVAEVRAGWKARAEAAEALADEWAREAVERHEQGHAAFNRGDQNASIVLATLAAALRDGSAALRAALADATAEQRAEGGA